MISRDRIRLTIRGRTATLVVSSVLSCRLAWRAVTLLDAIGPDVRLLRVDLRRLHVYDQSALRFLATAAHTWSWLRNMTLQLERPAGGFPAARGLWPAPPRSRRDSFVAKPWETRDALDAPLVVSVTKGAPSRAVLGPQPAPP